MSRNRDVQAASTAEHLWEALLRASAGLQPHASWEQAQRALARVARALGADGAHLLADASTAGAAEPLVSWTASRDTPERDPLAILGDPSSEPPAARCLTVTGGAQTDDNARPQRVLLCPVRGDGADGATLLFWRPVDGCDWPPDLAQRIKPFARHVAGWLHHHGRHAGEAREPQVIMKDGARSALPEVRVQQLRRRVQSQRALVEASKLLVGGDEVDMDALLAIVGEATGADYAYLLIIQPDDARGLAPSLGRSTQRPPIDLSDYTHYEWHAAGRPVARSTPRPDAVPIDGETADSTTFAVPLLSTQHRLFGYLGIEFDDGASPLENEDVRLLNVLGDLLSSYLQRQISERALRESEQRYRHFVSTISDAIWRIDVDPPLPVDTAPAALAAALRRQGVMGECNEELARLVGVERPGRLIGRSVGLLATITGLSIVRDVVDAGFQLRGQEYTVERPDETERHFIVNTSGVVEEGRLHSLWGSTTEVTERVDLERRMVSALEQHQQRIGRDLHDNVGQLLTGVRMLAQNLQERHLPAGSDGHQQVSRIVDYADEAARHVSDLQRGLMPVQMERAGLAQGLQELAGNTDVLPEVECLYDHDGEADVHAPEPKLQLYRIAQEAVNNALKHGDPSRITITLRTDGPRLCLQVQDDGTGFDVNEGTRNSLGLHSMAYRARALGATLDIASTRGQGTTVRCTVDRADLHEPPEDAP